MYPLKINSILKILTFSLIMLILIGCAYKNSPQREHNREKKQRKEQIAENNNRSSHQIIKLDEEKANSLEPQHKLHKLDGAEIFKKYSSAVFLIYTANQYQQFQGSGFFIGEDGLAVSNYHVFQGTSIGFEQIKIGNEVYNVSEIITRSAENDFILFRVNCTENNYIPIAKNKPDIGERVYAIGSPRGFENTITDGVVSQWRDKNLMQISVPIDHGSSGGVLINEYGETVGITSGTFYEGSSANVNYAISIDAVIPYL